MDIDSLSDDKPVGEKVDKMIENEVEEKLHKSNIDRMERLYDRQSEMYDHIKKRRRRDTIGFLVIVCLLSVGLYRQIQRSDDICDAAHANRSILQDVVNVAYKPETTPIDLTVLSGFEQIQDQGVIVWITSLSELFSAARNNEVPEDIQHALNREVC